EGERRGTGVSRLRDTRKGCAASTRRSHGGSLSWWVTLVVGRRRPAGARGRGARAPLRLGGTLPAARVEAVDELRRGAELLEDFLFESGALHLEALRFAEHGAGAVLLAAFEQRHTEVHEVRGGR